MGRPFVQDFIGICFVRPSTGLESPIGPRSVTTGPRGSRRAPFSRRATEVATCRRVLGARLKTRRGPYAFRTRCPYRLRYTAVIENTKEETASGRVLRYVYWPIVTIAVTTGKLAYRVKFVLDSQIAC